MLPGFPEADPLGGLAGGMLIGLAAALMLLGAGRIAGVSGIAARAGGLAEGGMPRSAAIAFLAGLPLGAALLALALERPAPSFPDWPYLIAAGLIVGFGTRLGSGCTSGHGVCGVSRFSRRALVATITFIAAGVASVAAIRALGLAQ